MLRGGDVISRRWPSGGEPGVDGGGLPAAVRGQGALQLHDLLGPVPRARQHPPRPAKVPGKGAYVREGWIYAHTHTEREREEL